MADVEQETLVETLVRCGDPSTVRWLTDHDAGVVVAERTRIVDELRAAADGYRTMTRKVLLELAAQIERADHEVVCLQCGELRSEIERSQSARRPIHCAVLGPDGEETQTWPRHRFARPRSDS